VLWLAAARGVSIDGNASDPLTGREHIAGYRITADQSAGMRAVHNPRQPIGKVLV